MLTHTDPFGVQRPREQSLQVEYYLAVMTFAFVGSITPGPNNIMLMASGLNHGVRKSIPHFLGISVGFPMMVAAVGAGMGAAFSLFPHLHRVITFVGVTYLLYLAWKIANAGNPKAASKTKAPLTFLQAASFQWVNPKAWVIAVGAIGAFTIPGQLVQSTSFIVLSYFVIGSISMSIWLILGQRLQLLLRSDRSIHYFNVAMGVLLVMSVIPIIVSEFQPGA